MALDKGWLDTVARGIDDARWDEYDTTIQTEINVYNVRMAATPGFKSIGWLLVKAMVWTESGGPDNPAWNGRVLQIGNRGDPAYGVLRRGAEGSAAVMSDELRTLLKKDDNIEQPEVNLRAGIAYLLTRMALFEEQSVADDTAPVRSYTVVAGDTLWKIALKQKSTLADLQRRNRIRPHALRAGMTLKVQPASMQLFIVGWRDFQSAVVADRYNGGGDPEYSAKLNHVLLDLLPKLKR